MKTAIKVPLKAALLAMATTVALLAVPTAQAQDGPPNVVPERVQPHGKAKLPHFRHHHKKHHHKHHHRHHGTVQPQG